MSGRSKSTLFLIEQLIVITVFAVCSAVCASIFVDAYLTAEGTSELNCALIAAKNGAERYKAYGALEETTSGVASTVIYYDGEWRVCVEADAAYVMRLDDDEAASPQLCELSVEKITGEEIIGFTVAGGERGE